MALLKWFRLTNRFNLCTFAIVVLILLDYFSSFVSLASDNISEYPGIKYCFSSMDLTDGNMFSNLEQLRSELDKNCTHVFGNIVINGIKTNDLRFLGTITEITGSLKIKNSNISIIPLSNLRIIRGKSKLHISDSYVGTENSLQILWDDEEFMPDSKVTLFDLRSLRSIVSGNIYLSSPQCSQLANINWNELLEDPKHQIVRGNYSTSTFPCSSSCPLIKGRRYCWGPSNDQCQKFSKCQKRMCANRCYISRSGEEECCNSQCLGGCTSSNADSCIACQGVLSKGKCQSQCPPKKIYSRDTGTLVDNQDFKPLFINLCVDKCPDNLLEQEGDCTSQCTIKNYEKKGDKCVPCLKYCEQICAMEEIFSERLIMLNLFSLDSKTIRKLKNCTTFKGSILIDKESFVKHSHLPELEPIKNASDLWNLKNLRNISGSIFIDLYTAPFNVNNFSFLSNLQVIEANSQDIPLSLGIYNTNITFLGLSSLVRIGLQGRPTKTIALINNVNLCYFSKKLFKKALNFNEDIDLDNLANSSKCVAEGKVCSEQCDSSLGCWGPGSSQCHRCAKKKLGSVCGDSCNTEPGYFESKAPVDDRICLKCHNECARTCFGQRSDECIGGCKHAMEGVNCVPHCSRTHYLNKKTKQCEKCNSECHARNLTELPICTGPSSKPGPGGCNKCQTLILDMHQNLERCTNSAVQSDYFSDNLPNTVDSPFSEYTEKFTDLIVTYQPCNPLCSKCTFASAQRIKALNPTQDLNGCLQCRGYWYLDLCVSKCPLDKTYLIADNRNSSKGECLPCHFQCRGCHKGGNDNCVRCSSYLILDHVNKSKFTCVDSCPISYKEKAFDSILNQTICLNVLLSKVELSMVIVAALFVLLLVIFAFVISNFCYRKNESRRKHKLKAFFSNANEKDSTSFVPPNMTKLPIISAECLEFDPNDVLGKGAFGTVFSGRWMPNESYFDDNTSINSCRDKMVDVAIKVVNKSCTIDDFMDEVKIMASVRHRHCLRLIGVCFKDRSYWLISSHIPLGSMDKYLINNKSKLTGSILLMWAEQIANGMLYLERNHIIHRDLATRNVLLFQENHVQITDFGLAKVLSSELIKISSGIVPVRWLAIESVRDGIYSHKTDVWAYAVTLWEIFSFAKTPYDKINANEIRDEIIKGTRLCQPEICSLEIYILMLKCWSVDPDDRPTFDYVWNEFKIFCNNPRTYLSYPNNNYVRPQHSADNNYLQVMDNVDDELRTLSRQSSRDTIPMSIRNGSMIRHSNQSDLQIPRNIATLLSVRPTRNKHYQPADEANTPFINNAESPMHMDDWNTFCTTPPVKHHVRHDHCPINKHATTEYMEPRNIIHTHN